MSVPQVSPIWTTVPCPSSVTATVVQVGEQVHGVEPLVVSMTHDAFTRLWDQSLPPHDGERLYDADMCTVIAASAGITEPLPYTYFFDADGQDLVTLILGFSYLRARDPGVLVFAWVLHTGLDDSDVFVVSTTMPEGIESSDPIEVPIGVDGSVVPWMLERTSKFMVEPDWIIGERVCLSDGRVYENSELQPMWTHTWVDLFIACAYLDATATPYAAQPWGAGLGPHIFIPTSADLLLHNGFASPAPQLRVVFDDAFIAELAPVCAELPDYQTVVEFVNHVDTYSTYTSDDAPEFWSPSWGLWCGQNYASVLLVRQALRERGVDSVVVFDERESSGLFAGYVVLTNQEIPGGVQVHWREIPEVMSRPELQQNLRHQHQVAREHVDDGLARLEHMSASEIDSGFPEGDGAGAVGEAFAIVEQYEVGGDYAVAFIDPVNTAAEVALQTMIDNDHRAWAMPMDVTTDGIIVHIWVPSSVEVYLGHPGGNHHLQPDHPLCLQMHMCVFCARNLFDHIAIHERFGLAVGDELIEVITVGPAWTRAELTLWRDLAADDANAHDP